MSAVAERFVAVPVTHPNTVVMSILALRYTQLAARLFARQDHGGIPALSGRTARWISVLPFPVLALTFCIAKPLTSTLYGERHAESWVIMQMLSLAYHSMFRLPLLGGLLRWTGGIGRA